MNVFRHSAGMYLHGGCRLALFSCLDYILQCLRPYVCQKKVRTTQSREDIWVCNLRLMQIVTLDVKNPTCTEKSLKKPQPVECGSVSSLLFF